MYAEQNKNNGI